MTEAFIVNDRVSHPKYGEGVVVGKYGNRLVVAFNKAGDKRVLPTYLKRAAPMAPAKFAEWQRRREERRKRGEEYRRQHPELRESVVIPTELADGDIFRRRRGFKRPPADHHAYKSGRVWWLCRKDEIPEAYGWDVVEIDETVATRTLGDLVIFREWIMDPNGNELISSLSNQPKRDVTLFESTNYLLRSLQQRNFDMDDHKPEPKRYDLGNMVPAGQA